MSQWSLAVVCESSSRSALAREIAKKLDVPFFLGVPLGPFDFLLGVTDERVELRLAGDEGLPLAVDFSRGAVNHRWRSKSQSRDLLLRAIGGTGKKVLDLTAGLATDSFILAGHGCHVTALEKNPVVGILVQDALERGLRDPSISEICSRISFQIGESVAFLAKCEAEFDVAYIDPMFPEKRKSALPKKELQILQILSGVGNLKTDEALVAGAGRRVRRVVVKRPVDAPALLRGVSSSIKGRSTRFDIYIFS